MYIRPVRPQAKVSFYFWCHKLSFELFDHALDPIARDSNTRFLKRQFVVSQNKTLCVCGVCVSVCVREKERERDSACVFEQKRFGERKKEKK
jgi:hypothetical protein